MKIKTAKNNDTLTISVEGKIDSATAPEFESTVKKEISKCSDLVFDFKKLDYISSAGLRILLGAQKLMGGHAMKVVNVNDSVYEIFEITGFSLILDIKKA